MIGATTLQAADVKTIEQFKQWIRREIRPIFPHEAFGCGLGHLHAGGVGLDYVVTVDFPVDHFHQIRNRAGGIDTPLLRRWLATREPQLFEADTPWPGVPAAWLESFRYHDLQNAAAHGVYDTDRCVGTYHSFHRIRGHLGSAHADALKLLIPVMHDALCQLIESLNLKTSFAMRFSTLSSREKEVAKWVSLGKSNGETAAVSGLSENTVKHHIGNIFTKLGVETRTQLVRQLTEYEVKAAPSFGTKIL